MSIQKDFRTGLDFSGKPNITFADLIQAINGIAPLSNIGGVIFGTVTPDVTNNPRFERYLWLDDNTNPPTPRYYNTGTLAWDATVVADASITAAKLAAHTAILDHFFNATAADATKANRILKFDSSGDLIEAVALATLLSANSVPLTALDKTGAADYQVLQYRTSDGLTSFRTLNGDAFAAGGIGLAKLAAGTNTHVLQMVAGVWTSIALKSVFSGADEDNSAYLTIFGTGAYVPKNSSAGASAAPLQVPQRNAANTATLWTTPILSKEYSVSAAGTLADGAISHAHSLGAMPKIIRVVAVNVVTEAGWAVGDEVEDIFILGSGSDSDGRRVFSQGADATNLTIATSSAANAAVRHKTTGVATAITAANWRYKVYAYA